MNFKFLMPLAAGIFPFMAYAVGDVSGLVVNKDTKAPMDFVTVQLLDASTGKPLPIGTNTDEKGSFTIKNVKDGKYIVKITNIGSHPQECLVEVKGEMPILARSCSSTTTRCSKRWSWRA